MTYNNHIQANNRIPSSAPVAVPEGEEAPVGSDAEYDFLFRRDPDGPPAAVPEPLCAGCRFGLSSPQWDWGDETWYQVWPSKK